MGLIRFDYKRRNRMRQDNLAFWIGLRSISFPMDSTGRDLNRIIGERIRTAREDRGSNQEGLSKAVGFKDRQTLSAIENGQRKVSGPELMRFAELLNKPFEFFTDPYQLPSTAAFSWRANVSESTLAKFQEHARALLAANLRFMDLNGEKRDPLRNRLSLTQRSSFEKAATMGSDLAERWEILPAPYAKLSEAIETRLGVVVAEVQEDDLPRDGGQESGRSSRQVGKALHSSVARGETNPAETGRLVDLTGAQPEGFVAGLAMDSGNNESLIPAGSGVDRLNILVWHGISLARFRVLPHDVQQTKPTSHHAQRRRNPPDHRRLDAESGRIHGA